MWPNRNHGHSGHKSWGVSDSFRVEVAFGEELATKATKATFGDESINLPQKSQKSQ
jgi:hypothetical protein